jgi:thiol-disulfide isomerase/thioredoxin
MKSVIAPAVGFALVFHAGALCRAAHAFQESKPPSDVAAPMPASADNPEARMILEACGQAIKEARAITYQAHSRPVGGMLEGLMGSQRASVTLLRAPAPGAEPVASDPFLILVKGTDVDRAKKESAIEVGHRQGTIEWVDHTARFVYERPLHDAKAKNKIIQASKSVRHDEFLKPQPLAASLTGATTTLDGSETLDGVECDVITLVKSTSRKERWYVAKADRLPRRIVTSMPGDNGELVLDLTQVTVDNSLTPALTPEAIRVGVPEGYEEDRATAPPPPPPQPQPISQPQTPMPDGGAAKTPVTIVAPVTPPKPPEPVVAPDFDLAVGQGSGGTAPPRVKLADIKGSVIVLDFFGTWSLAAPAWHAELDEVAEVFASRGVKFYALNVREKNSDNAIAYMEREKHSLTLLLNADAVAKAYGVRVFPATVVIGKDGMIGVLVQGSREGGDTKGLITAAIEKALGPAVGETPTPDKATAEGTPSAEEPAATDKK